jgi:hypothetical protein
MLLPGLCLALLAAAQQPRDDDLHTSRILAILDQAERQSEQTTETLSRRIAFLGSDALPAVLEILEQDRGCDPDRERPMLSARQIEILHGSLAMSTRDAVIGLLEERTAENPCPKLVLGILAELGHGEDIALGLLVLEPASSDDFEHTVTRILKRDPGAYALVKGHIREQSPDNASTLVRAAGATASYAGLQMLLELLGQDVGLDRVLLPHIGQIGRAAPWHVDDLARHRVRGYLTGQDESMLRAALFAVGGMQDFRSVERVIELLGSDSRSVREAAHWALKAGTGLAFSADPDRWEAWHASESEWYERNAGRLFRRIAMTSSRGIAEALRELSVCRYQSGKTAEGILGLLNHHDPFVRGEACQALRNLRAGIAVPALLSSMTDADPGVAQEAWRALQSITGKQVPFEIDAWSRELQVQL